MYVLEGSESAMSLTQFLQYGTELITWIVSSALNMITSLMGNPVTAAFIILGLVYVVINVVSRFTRH